MSEPAIPMSPAQAIKALDKIALKIGAKAKWAVWLSEYNRDLPLKASFYPSERYSAGAIFSCGGNTFEELLTSAEAAWLEHSDDHARSTIRDMALAIIRITDEHGHCSDQMLRVEFAPADVKRFGDQACTKAAEMAARGPFSIVATTGANALAA